MKTIQVSEETYEKIKPHLLLEEKIDLNSLQDLVGKKFFMRTVTYHLTGKVTKIVGNILCLDDAAFIADSGRFMQAIKDGTLKEVEPVGEAFVNFAAITDFFPWKHELPKEQK